MKTPKGDTTELPLGEGLEFVITQVLQDYFAAHQDISPPEGLYQRVMREMEAPLIRETLRSVWGNQMRAAEILGIHRNTLRRKIKDLGLLE